MTKIRKAVIPVAGYGTGFLPATKAQPKELLPIVDKPIIQFTVEEAKASGIEEIVVITGRHKRPVEDHFDSYPELEENLIETNKLDLLKKVQETTITDLYYVRQPYPHGLADALYYAKPFIGDEPFALMLADNIFYSDVPVMKQLIDAYQDYPHSMIGTSPVDDSIVHRYGIVEKGKPCSESDSIYRIDDLVEKPSRAEAPSNDALVGRYILHPEIFDVIERMQSENPRDYDLTQAINEYRKEYPVLVKDIEVERYDVGNKLGYMRMSLQYGLMHPETKDELKTYLLDLANRLV